MEYSLVYYYYYIVNIVIIIKKIKHARLTVSLLLFKTQMKIVGSDAQSFFLPSTIITKFIENDILMPFTNRFKNLTSPTNNEFYGIYGMY